MADYDSKFERGLNRLLPQGPQCLIFAHHTLKRLWGFQMSTPLVAEDQPASETMVLNGIAPTKTI